MVSVVVCKTRILNSDGRFIFGVVLVKMVVVSLKKNQLSISSKF